MMVKPMKTLELHYSMIQFLIKVNIWRFIYLNCGEWYEDMIDDRSYTSFSTVQIREPSCMYVWVIDQVWGQDGWILAKFFFCVFMDRDEVEVNCWFSHDVTKFQTSELLIFLRFYFHDVLEQPKTNLHTNFHSEWVLGLVIDYAWISISFARRGIYMPG